MTAFGKLCLCLCRARTFLPPHKTCWHSAAEWLTSIKGISGWLVGQLNSPWASQQRLRDRPRIFRPDLETTYKNAAVGFWCINWPTRQTKLTVRCNSWAQTCQVNRPLHTICMTLPQTLTMSTREGSQTSRAKQMYRCQIQQSLARVLRLFSLKADVMGKQKTSFRLKHGVFCEICDIL